MNLLRKSLALCAIFGASCVHASLWEQIQQPISGAPQPIGGYSNGCIIGAKPLALKGEGYQVIRSQRSRFYGHPDLLNFITRLAKNAQGQGLSTLLIADMGMAAGGRFSSGHASHQTGLDVDIWLGFGPLSEQQAQNPTPTLMVNHDTNSINENLWTTKQTEMIRLAAQDPRVDRIFLNPVIKVKLCQSVQGDRAWLRKVRPWYGHDYHMHVRLSCPEGAPACQNQAPVPMGEGCGDELYSWFEPAKNSTTKAKNLPMPPIQCQMILAEKGLN